MLTKLSRDGMTQIPTDPISGALYGYSVLAFGPGASQVRIDYEGDLRAQ